MVARGELWWGETPDDKGRPFLVVSRDAANDVMQRVLVAPVTTRVRGVPSELSVGVGEGLPRPSVASFDNLRPFPKAMLTRRRLGDEIACCQVTEEAHLGFGTQPVATR